MKYPSRFIVAAIFLSLAFSGLSIAQQDKRQNTKPEGGFFDRIISENYKMPVTYPYESGADASLDAMIRDGKLEISQEDVIRLALENNVDINIERYSPYFNVWGVERNKSILNPIVGFNSNFNRMVTPASSFLQGGTTVLNIASVYDFTVHKPFEPGLDLDFEFKTTRSRTNSLFFNLNPYVTPVLGIGITQHLLKDQGRISRSRGLKIARNTVGMSEDAFIAKTSELLTNVLNTYWDLAYCEDDIRLKEASLKLAQVVLDQNKIQAEVGTLAPLDVVQAEAEVASRKQQLVVAQFNRKLAENQMKKLISSRNDPGMIEAQIITATKPSDPPAPVSDVGQAVQRAMEIRPEIKQALLDLDNRKIQVQYTKNQLRPVLDFTASFSQNGLGGNQIIREQLPDQIWGGPIIGTIPGGIWDSLNSLFSEKYLGYALGLNLKLPVGNDEARANSAQAQIDVRQAEERMRALRQAIALEIRQAYDRYNLNQASLQAAEVTVRYQKQRLQGEQDKYNLGATTTRSVIEAQRDLQDAYTIWIRARIDLIKSRIAIDKAIGETFPAHNIELNEALKRK
jgi:outer membrane protein TolC